MKVTTESLGCSISKETGAVITCKSCHTYRHPRLRMHGVTRPLLCICSVIAGPGTVQLTATRYHLKIVPWSVEIPLKYR
jgi:hypothetical protein